MPEGKQTKGPDYIETLNPQGYLNNREITNLPGIFLVSPSKNCVIVNKEKVSSRKGYTVMGGAKTKNKGHRSSFDWERHLNNTRSLRVNADGELEVHYKSAHHLLKTHAVGARMNFAPWWDTSETLDKLLYVDQTANVYSWGGGVVNVASGTSITLTLQGRVIETTIAFNDNGASGDTITDSGNGFVIAGFAVGDVITIAGSTSNDGTYTIKAVVAGTITLADSDSLTTEVAGDTVTLSRPNSTWASQGFLTTGTRSIRINAVEYTYTGGETTHILTGLTALASVTAADVCMQAVITSTPGTLSGLTLDLIAVQNNYVFYGDLTNREVNISTDSDFTSFSFTSPLRAPGEGFKLTLDSTPTAFVPSAVEDEFYIAARKDDWYRITFNLSADNSDEVIRIKKLPTATGQGARSQGAIIRIKNGTAFMSFEPTIDVLSRIASIDTPQSLPLSHDIKNDITTYDLTDVHGLYFQNQMFFCLPAEGLIIIYDFEQQLWQPPHTLPIGRLALIDVDSDGTQVLCGHSSVSNETYKLYDGFNDNDAPIRIEMHFGYDNFGSRFTQKGADEFATELFMSENTNVTNRVVYDYKGATSVREFTIKGDDDTIRFRPITGGGFGFEKLGSDPLGSLATSVDDLSKFKVVNMTPPKDFFERQRVFISDDLDARFSVIAYGDNVELSDNIPNYIKR